MGFFDNLKIALRKWFLHDTAKASGAPLSNTPKMPATEKAIEPIPSPPIAPRQPEDDAPPPIRVEMKASKPATTPAQPDVIDNTLKIITGVVKLAKTTGILGGGAKPRRLPPKSADDDSDQSDDSESEDSDPNFVADSSEVVD